ncbi:MAG: Smr/MutS family protein [Nitrospinae bacterium]|nr:Smr/MutS family protein [Nitrospinota bacterium]
MSADRSFSRTARALEFDGICRELSARCKTERGRETCLNLVPTAAQYDAERLRDETIEMADLLSAGELFFPNEVADPAPAVTRIRRGSLPEPDDLKTLLGFLHQAERTAEFLSGAGQTVHRLAELCADFTPLDEMTEFFNATFAGDGSIRPDASALLMDLESRIASLQRKIHERAEQLLARRDLLDKFQDAYVTIRNGRVVLPVKAEYKNTFPGIIHGISASDKTVFMEPQELVKDNNLLQESIAERDEEHYRLLRQAAQMVMDQAQTMEKDYAVIGALDAVCARAAFSAAIGGTPAVFTAGGAVRLLSLRHPLMALRGEKPVPNDLLMREGEKTLVISGPNAGGKTVFLKTAGLCVLLAACGVFPPVARGSEFPFVTKLFALAGDEQSIAEGESTFSAQIAGIRDALAGAGPGTWVMVDEILNGTDPAQAGALATAVLEFLIQKDCRTFVSTHLPALKVAAQENSAMVNAAMGFGPDNRPTFRLAKGHPGVSHPLDVAESVGIPMEIIQNAKAKLSDTQDKYQAALLDLQRKSDEMDKAQTRIAAKEENLLRREEEVAGKLEEAERLKSEIEREKRKRIKEEVAKAREEIFALLAAAQDERSRTEAARKLKERETELVREIHIPDSVPLETLKEGDAVWVVPLDKNAKLIRRAGNRVEVQVGEARMTLSVTDVIGLKQKQEAVPKRPAPIYRGEAETPEISLMGLTGDEALPLLDKFLDSQLLTGTDRVKIIHGRGVLRSKVLDYLKTSPYIKSFAVGAGAEGGDAVTLAELKD